VFAFAYSPAYGPNRVTTNPFDPSSALDDTVTAWRSWSDMHGNYHGAYAGLVKTSALVLQGLTYQPSGAVVAAATTSLPERLGGEWNWDYRFCWLRDASLMMRALWVAACPHEPGRFFRFLEQAGGRLGQAAVQIMYGVEGERRLLEGELDHLRGFAGSRPVRTGNAAWRQKQLDVLGEVLDAAHVLRDQLGELEEGTRELLTALADRAAASWKEPDAGMWETREAERHFVSSKVMCWVALDRALILADRLAADDRRRSVWASARQEVGDAVMEHGWNEKIQAFTGAFGSDHLDASVLLLPLIGFLPADHPQMRSTIEVVDRELNDGGFVRRWREEENGFLISSYWLAQCLTLAGETGRAQTLFDQASGAANDLGLLAEMADPTTGTMLGNYPQAFSHVGLINAAWRLTEARSAAGPSDRSTPPRR
jgi:GH15 family glucan-1,4-alpha-glucosidase